MLSDELQGKSMEELTEDQLERYIEALRTAIAALKFIEYRARAEKAKRKN